MTVNSLRLCGAMLRAELTVSKLAQAASISEATIYRMLNGNSHVRAASLWKIARVLHIDPEELLCSAQNSS